MAAYPWQKVGRASRVVVIGGGTGAPASIRASLLSGFQTTAVVAMADDGGSSGMLRNRIGSVPPGDIRKCLIAMTEDSSGPWARAFRQRFEYLNNHTLGNLILSTLEDTAGSFPEAIRLCEELLDVRGHVLPSTLSNVNMHGITRDGAHVSGQSSLCASKTALTSVSLVGDAIAAYPPACEAIREADLIVLGPGSLFTSIIAALLVPGIIDAIKESQAFVVFVTPITDMQGETWGLCASELVESLMSHGIGSRLDGVILNSNNSDAAHRGAVTAVFNAIDVIDAIDATYAIDATDAATATTSTVNTAPSRPIIAPTDNHASASMLPEVRMLACSQEDERRIAQMGLVLMSRTLTNPEKPRCHCIKSLARVFKEVIEDCRLLRR